MTVKWYIYFNNQSPNWKTVLFVESTKLFIPIVSEFIDIFVKFSNFMSREWGFWLPILSRGEGFCMQWFSWGKSFCSLQVVPGVYPGGRGMVLDEIDTCISRKDRKHLFANMFFFKLSRYGFVSISLQWSQVLMFHKKYLQWIILKALKSYLRHHRKHVLRLLQLYGDQA